MLCDRCDTMECVKVCYMRALQTSGKWYAVDELMRLFNRDRCYWGPEGGITLTGGEPLLQQEFVLNLLARCHDAGIAACVETSAHVPRTVLQAALPYIQWLFVDLKHMDSGGTGKAQACRTNSFSTTFVGSGAQTGRDEWCYERRLFRASTTRRQRAGNR